MMKELIKSDKKKNYLVSVIIGKDYYKRWESFAFKSWKNYCKKYGLGLVVFTDHIIKKNNKFWKIPNWQKLLIGNKIQEKISVNNLCLLDCDIIINYFNAPNIFDHYKNNKTFGLISQINNLPYDEYTVKKRMAYFRNKFYSKKYPLDSALFMNLRQMYKFNGLKPQKDYACTGVIVFNAKNHSKDMNDWFFKYDKKVKTLTGGGEEGHLNYEMQKTKKITWLDYKFQALWNYEMAYNYPFLYKLRHNKELIIECVRASLMNNYFLHFAGMWHENEAWQNKNIFNDIEYEKLIYNFVDYLKVKPTGKSKGVRKP